MNSLKFGTSGLRGLVTDLLGWPSYAYATAFLRSLGAGDVSGARREVLIGRDLRASSPEIAAACIAAAHAEGWVPVDVGALPTPALALESLSRGAAAIMVTGSHIPDNRNGLKFYTAEGEITKSDETAILAALDGVLAEVGANPPSPVLHPAPEDTAEASVLGRYRMRYTEAFAPDCLSGLTVGIYQHSTVARDLLADLVSALGGTAVPFSRSEAFVPVDTEAHRIEDLILLGAFAKANKVDAIVSADGDADRPLIADADGRVLRGDVIGLLTALDLRVDTIVTPVTSISSIERAVAPSAVARTRVGSPYVIAGIEAAVAAGRQGVIGFEANGGVLLGTDAFRDGRLLARLATRDAVLPILSILASIRTDGRPLSARVDGLGIGAAGAHRLQNTPPAASGALLAALGGDRSFAEDYFQEIGAIAGVDTLDGVRTRFADGRIVHYRASGNAPELRCYVEASDEADVESLLRWGLDRAGRFLQQKATT
ncbi:MAG: phosphomannomutase [Rhizobiaceae bacterium]|nr:phosphomannomutase [Rhizobiaceae bacterium]